MTTTEIVTEDGIKDKIVPLRGVQVMLDRDLADAYQVPLRVFNQAVKRNLKRFPDNFMFEVDKEEIRPLITNCDLLEKMRYWPKKSMAFTEQGIAMLSAVLRSDTAIEISIRIMNAFVSMRRVLAATVPMASRIEELERRQIVDQAHNEKRFERIFSQLSEGEVPDHQIFYQGSFWDAKSLLIKFIRRAKKELIVVDAYIGVATLDMLAKRGRGVSVEIITPSNGDLAESDFEAFGRQYGNLTITTCGICHDRCIIADGKEMYAIGASLKDAGRQTFCVMKSGEAMIQGLLANLRSATSAQRVYGGR